MVSIKKGSNMKTEIVKVNSYLHYLICPTCGARMDHTGLSLSSQPPQYLHKCPSKDCSYQEFTAEVYPKIGHLPDKVKESSDADET